jgi:methylated-DNA-[protein]-cysteine S-methyltransferase
MRRDRTKSDPDSYSLSVAIVETRYAVPGWGFGELWRRDEIVLAHDFHFAPVSDTVSDTKTDGSGDVLDGHAHELLGRFRAFLRGEDVSFADVAIDVDWATPFQRVLVDALRTVPRGEVVSYGELAALAGRPGAPRAAGALCAANRFTFVVPCHRVVAAHGIGGYGSAGVEVKRRLLALEGVEL